MFSTRNIGRKNAQWQEMDPCSSAYSIVGVEDTYYTTRALPAQLQFPSHSAGNVLAM